MGGYFHVPTNDSYDSMAAAPQYFIYARGPLASPGVLGAHFDPEIEYPYGGIDIAISPVFDHAVDGNDPEASLRAPPAAVPRQQPEWLEGSINPVPEPELEEEYDAFWQLPGLASASVGRP